MKMPARLLAIVALAPLAFATTQCRRAKQVLKNPPATETPKPPDPPGFAIIPAGEFTMGDALDGTELVPQHKVYVGAFYMQKTEVTKALWDEVRAWGLKHGYPDLVGGEGKAADHPAQLVSWYNVVKWCNAKSEKEGIIPCYYTDAAQKEVYRSDDSDPGELTVKWNAKGYRLPTSAEWEKAARGGLEGKRFPWGDTMSHSEANFNNAWKESYQTGTTGFHPAYKTGDVPYTSPVGSFAANGYGLYDLAGNVWEWCWDWYGNDSTAVQADPRGPASGKGRVFRGGAWDYYAFYCRTAVARSNGPANASCRIGFRLARSAPP
jgi:formylglycine-generating enzyme required for sulfatase activity